MQQPTPFTLVSTAASKANVQLRAEDLNRIRSCRPDSGLARWVQGNLVNERVLSTEEVWLGDAANAGVESGNVPLTEEELLLAIAELERETEMWDRQTGVLERQEEKRKDEAKRECSRRKFAESMRERDSAKIQQLESQIAEATGEVEGLLREMREAVEKTTRSIPGLMRSVLGGHDAVLKDLNLKEGGLGVLQSETQTSISIETDMVERLSTLLAGMLAEELQVRLDRVYLEALHGGLDDEEDTSIENGNPAEDAAALQQDLNSLYAEIPDVAAMFVAQQYSEPLLSALREVERRRDEVEREREKRIIGVIRGVTGELEGLTERLRGFHSWRTVLREMGVGFEEFRRDRAGGRLEVGNKRGGERRDMGEAVQGMMRHFGVGATNSRDLHQVLDEKVERLQESIGLEGLHAGVKERAVYDERKRIVEMLESGVEDDQKGGESLEKMNALEARITSLRNEVEIIGRADTGEMARRQREFVERWS
jgi:hypothetical protein